MSSSRPRLPVQYAASLSALDAAFRAQPLAGDEFRFYEDKLNRLRGTSARRAIRDSLEQSFSAFHFKGVLYGNRGTGKSTEINKLLEEPFIKDHFLIVRIDALHELNPQTSSAVDVLILLFIRLFEACEQHCLEHKVPTPNIALLVNDFQKQLEPFFPELQQKVQQTSSKGGGGEATFFGLVKTSIRIEGQTRTDQVADRTQLSDLSTLLDKLINLVSDAIPGREPLIIAENFDREQISRALLDDCFVKYASLLRSFRLHMLFTLPAAFVHEKSADLPFSQASRFPLYDVPVFQQNNDKHEEGVAAIRSLIARRADPDLFRSDALDLLVTASGGDMYELFALVTRSVRIARYRLEDDPSDTRNQILRSDVETVVRERIFTFRQELGTSAASVDKTTWPQKLEKLKEIYEQKPGHNSPDETLYHLLRRRAVLFLDQGGDATRYIRWSSRCSAPTCRRSPIRVAASRSRKWSAIVLTGFSAPSATGSTRWATDRPWSPSMTLGTATN